MGTNGTAKTTQTQRIPPIGTSNQDRASSHDRSSPPDRTSVPDRTSIHNRTGARVWNRPGERQSADDLTRPPSTRPIYPTPLAQTREEVTELQGMVSLLIDKTRNQEVAYRTIVNQLDQTERELAEHQANARKRNQPPSDPLRGSLNPQNTGAFSTPEIPSARSGRYMGENSQRLLQQGLAHRSFSYSGLDEIETGLQGPQSTLIQSQNGYTERPGEPRTRIPPLSHPTSENRTPSATKTFQQTGFGDPI